MSAVALVVVAVRQFGAGEPDAARVDEPSEITGTQTSAKSVPACTGPAVEHKSRVVSIPPREYYDGLLTATKRPKEVDNWRLFDNEGLFLSRGTINYRELRGEATVEHDEIVCAYASGRASDRTLLFLAGAVPELEALHLWQAPFVTRRGLEHLTFWPNLRYLSLGSVPNDFGFGEGDLDVLQGIKSLTHLRIWYGIDTEGFLHIAKLQNLEYLDISVPHVGDDGYELQNLRNLRQLKLWSIRHSGPWIESLASMPDLQVLTIHATYGFSDDAYDQLAALPRLRVLSLSSSSGITEAQVMRLSKSASLRELSLWSGYGTQTELTAETLRALQPMGLSALSLIGYPHLADDVLEVLAKYDSLEHLELSRCIHLTGTGLIEVARLPKLKRLVLKNCENIAMEHVLALKEIDRPLYVDLTGCKHVTYLGARDLMDANPNLTILADRFR